MRLLALIPALLFAGALSLTAPAAGHARTPDYVAMMDRGFPDDGSDRDREDRQALAAARDVFDLAMQRMTEAMQAALKDKTGAPLTHALDAAQSDGDLFAGYYADAVVGFARDRLYRIEEPDRRWRVENGLTLLRQEIARSPRDLREDLEREARLARTNSQ